MKNYVDKDKLQEFAIKLNNKQKTIFATKSEVGSPLVASTVAEMTDTSRVYVYVGSESGYTSGNWYYYDGSAWTSGGVYNSTAFETDETLAIPGAAADAKATGDKYTSLKNVLDYAFSLSISANVTTIPNGTDYNTLLTAGNFAVGSVSSAQTMTNCPVSVGHRLFVISTTNAARLIQIVISNSSYPQIYKRYYNGSTWSTWTKLLDNNDYIIDNTLSVSGNSADAKATGDKITSIENKTISYLINQLFQDSTFDIKKLTINDNGYITLKEDLETLHTNFAYIKNTKNNDIISVDAVLLGTSNGARIVLKDTNGNVIFVLFGYTSGNMRIMFYDDTVTEIPNTRINTNIADDSKLNHNIKIVKIGYTLFCYYDGVYCGKADLTNYLGYDIAENGFGWRGNISNNSRYIKHLSNEIKSFAHFSFDDQLDVLKDITNNSETYTSIFDNSDLNGLKQLHDTYGCVFTLNLFYQDDVSNPTFTLDNVTTKFKTEFAENAHWLKFAYHGKDPSTHPSAMTTADLVANVQAVYNAVDNFAGNVCIDKVARMSFFDCTSEQAIALKTNGLMDGYLTADDTRTSNTGLNADEREIVQNYDSYTDYVNNITYFRTEPRFDSGTLEDLLAQYNALYNSPNNHKQFVLFAHGYTGTKLTKLQGIAEWCFKHNMTFDYPMNNLTY